MTHKYHSRANRYSGFSHSASASCLCARQCCHDRLFGNEIDANIDSLTASMMCSRFSYRQSPPVCSHLLLSLLASALACFLIILRARVYPSSRTTTRTLELRARKEKRARLMTAARVSVECARCFLARNLFTRSSRRRLISANSKLMLSVISARAGSERWRHSCTGELMAIVKSQLTNQ